MPIKSNKKSLTTNQADALLDTLQTRFEKNKSRHPGLDWADVKAKLETNPEILWSLNEMETTGGEPDVVSNVATKNELIFVDCSVESPKGRRSLCYDRSALDARREAKPANSVMDLVESMGVELLNEQQYRALQETGEFDLKTSSWVLTPPKIRKLGGALYCDRRYDTVFLGHNGADSYYAARGFRAVLRV